MSKIENKIEANDRSILEVLDNKKYTVDYDKNAPLTREFFASVQNKLHWAITGKTAAETIYQLSDGSRPHMGLITWKQSPEGKVLKSDIGVANNYLNEAHIRELNRIVSAYLDLAENRAEFEVFHQRQDAEHVSDFDRKVKRIQGKAKDGPH